MIRSNPSSRFLIVLGCVALLTLALAATAAEDEKAAPTVSEQIQSLESMCAENAEAMATRQSEKSLYERLGGEKRIHEIVTEVVRLHGVNEPIKHMVKDIDQKHLITMVTQFLVAGTGGPAEYTGLNMVDAHTHLKLTNADFLAAGSDVMKAMKTKGCTEGEIQEIICSFVSLRAQVVIDSEKVIQ